MPSGCTVGRKSSTERGVEPCSFLFLRRSAWVDVERPEHRSTQSLLMAGPDGATETPLSHGCETLSDVVVRTSALLVPVRNQILR